MKRKSKSKAGGVETITLPKESVHAILFHWMTSRWDTTRLHLIPLADVVGEMESLGMTGFLEVDPFGVCQAYIDAVNLSRETKVPRTVPEVDSQDGDARIRAAMEEHERRGGTRISVKDLELDGPSPYSTWVVNPFGQHFKVMHGNRDAINRHQLRIDGCNVFGSELDMVEGLAVDSVDLELIGTADTLRTYGQGQFWCVTSAKTGDTTFTGWRDVHKWLLLKHPPISYE